jgi:hypothetical protein
MTDVDSFLMMLNIAAAIASIYVIPYSMAKLAFFIALFKQNWKMSQAE